MSSKGQGGPEDQLKRSSRTPEAKHAIKMYRGREDGGGGKDSFAPSYNNNKKIISEALSIEACTVMFCKSINLKSICHMVLLISHVTEDKKLYHSNDFL